MDARDSAETFIERHVRIEDKDIPGGVTPFILWPDQKQALADFDIYRLIDAYKTRQCGFTWLVLADTAWRMVFNPAYATKALSAREDPDAKELVRRLSFILRHLPPWMIRERKGCDPRFQGPAWDATALAVTVYHRNAEDAVFQSLSAAPGSGRMLTGNRLFIDEWAFQEFAKEIWASAFPTVNRPTGGQVIGCSTMQIGTLFDEISRAAETDITDGVGSNGFHEIFLGRWVDPRRDQEWFEATKLAFPNSWRSEYPETPEEGRSVGEGAFFEEWQELIHVPVAHWEPPNDPRWPIFGVYDPGYNRSCFKWYTVSPGVDGLPRGWIRCFREYYPQNTIDSLQAQDILRLSCHDDGKKSKIWLPKLGMELDASGTPFKFKKILMDSSAETPGRGTGKSTAAVFRDYELYMTPADKDLENGWRRLHEWLAPRPYPGREDTGISTAYLTFTKDCGASRSTYPSCRQSKTNPGDISTATPHDPQDCDRYLVMSQPKPEDYKPDPLEGLAQKHPAWSISYQVHAKELTRDDPRHEVTLDDLGM